MKESSNELSESFDRKFEKFPMKDSDLEESANELSKSFDSKLSESSLAGLFNSEYFDSKLSNFGPINYRAGWMEPANEYIPEVIPPKPQWQTRNRLPDYGRERIRQCARRSYYRRLLRDGQSTSVNADKYRLIIFCAFRIATPESLAPSQVD
jgi:hypothetical protein